MTNTLFHLSALFVLPFWFLMIFMPHYRLTHKALRSPWIILPPVICYVLLLSLNTEIRMLELFLRPSPEYLATIMKEPWASAIFWAYAGAFDLFVGRWIYLDSKERDIRHRLIAPILLVCIFFGPVAFLMYGILIFVINQLRQSSSDELE